MKFVNAPFNRTLTHGLRRRWRMCRATLPMLSRSHHRSVRRLCKPCPHFLITSLALCYQAADEATAEATALAMWVPPPPDMTQAMACVRSGDFDSALTHVAQAQVPVTKGRSIRVRVMGSGPVSWFGHVGFMEPES